MSVANSCLADTECVRCDTQNDITHNHKLKINSLFSFTSAGGAGSAANDGERSEFAGVSTA